ncbi:MAG: hypothetical protein QM808_14780 [Steroidobacteraceae bacterium]
MKHTTGLITLAAALLSSVSAFAATDTITTQEEHVLRGFFDRQGPVIAVDNLALTKGSAAIKAYAQSELDMYKKLGTGLQALFDKYQLTIRPNPTGEYRPLEQGKSRGVPQPLPEGWRYATVDVFGLLENKGPVIVPRPAMCQSTTVAGCADPVAPGVDLSKLSGQEFDDAYLLWTFFGHEAMIRHATDELLFDETNPDMVKYAKDAIKTISAQSKVADGLYRGTAKKNANSGAAPARQTK